MPSGGYRKPSAPAPASGPGRLSRRTDGGPGQKMRDLPNASYGEAAAYSEAQSGAALNLADGALTPSASSAPQGPVNVIGFGDPTMHPDQPVTAGAPFGAGPGIESMGLVTDTSAFTEDRKKMVAYLPALEYIANGPNALPSLRMIVRKIKASAGL